MDKYLKTIQEIIGKKLEAYPVRVYLFGSQATGIKRTGSDCDIGIEPLSRLPVGLLSELRDELEESHVPYTVELVDLSQASHEFSERVKKRGILWIDTSKG